jgi:hypothetical protein
MSLPKSISVAATLVLALQAGVGWAAPANDSPTSPETLDGCNGLVVGTTVAAVDDVSFIECPNSGDDPPRSVDPYGGDVFYRITVPWSFQVNVIVEPVGDWDVSIYGYTEITNPAETCRDASDAGGPGDAEMIQLVSDHPSGQARDFYIAVDSWRMDSSGEFTLSVTCDFTVGTTTPSFSTLKARFAGDQ